MTSGTAINASHEVRASTGETRPKTPLIVVVDPTLGSPVLDNGRVSLNLTLQALGRMGVDVAVWTAEPGQANEGTLRRFDPLHPGGVDVPLDPEVEWSRVEGILARLPMSVDTAKVLEGAQTKFPSVPVVGDASDAVVHQGTTYSDGSSLDRRFANVRGFAVVTVTNEGLRSKLRHTADEIVVTAQPRAAHQKAGGRNYLPEADSEAFEHDEMVAQWFFGASRARTMVEQGIESRSVGSRRPQTDLLRGLPVKTIETHSGFGA